MQAVAGEARDPCEDIVAKDRGGREDSACCGGDHHRHYGNDEHHEHPGREIFTGEETNRIERAIGVRHERRQPERDGNHAESQVEHAGQDAGLHGSVWALGREHPLLEILAGDVAEEASGPGTEPAEEDCQGWVGRKEADVFWMGLGHPGEDGRKPAQRVTVAQPRVGERCGRQHDEADECDHDLDGIGKCHRPHTADQRVDEGDRCHDQNPGHQWQAEVEFQNLRQRRVLERHPGEVGRYLDAGPHQFGCWAVFYPVEVGHRVEPHLPQRPGEEDAGQHERAGAGERIEDHAAEPFLAGGTRGGKHRGRTKPGGDQRAPGEEQG